MSRGTRRARQGIVLIVTLWVLTILAVLALTFAATMHVEARAAANEVQRTRALYAAKAGVQRAILAISQDQTGYASALSEWAQFNSQDEPLPFSDDEQYEVSVTDECGKINLNAADEELLAKLPQMTPEMIDSILDWRDQDDEPRPNGAEIEYYSRLKPPRVCANRPFLTLPELLLVRGITREAFYGSRAIGPLRTRATFDEAASEEEALPLEELLTLYGGANDTDAQGRERLNINVADAQQIAERTQGILNEGDIQAIIDHRTNVREFNSIGELLGIEGITREKVRQVADLLTTRSRPSGEAQATSTQQPQSSAQGPSGPTLPGLQPGLPLLPGAEAESPQQMPQPPVTPPSSPPGVVPGLPGGTPGSPGVPSPIPTPGAQGPEGQRMTNVADIDLSALPEARTYRPNIININTAPPEVLATLDGMTEQALEAIVQYREQQPFTSRGDLLALPEVTDSVFTQIVEEITVRSSTLRITSVGSVEEGRVRVQVTVLLDLKGPEPRIVYIAVG